MEEKPSSQSGVFNSRGINPHETSMLARNLSMAEARMCFNRVPSTAIPVRSCNGGCDTKGIIQHSSLTMIPTEHTHQYLRVHLVEGCRQVGDHASQGDVMSGIPAIMQNIGEDSHKLGYATRQFF